MKPWVWIALGLVAVVGILFIPVRGRTQVPSMTLDWTAPGDDSLTGTATFYQLRRATSKPDTTSLAAMDAWWAAATPCTGLPIPAIAGTRQSTVVLPSTGTVFSPGTYYFVLKACDERPNCSPYSNVAVGVVPVVDNTPPARVVDLLIR